MLVHQGVLISKLNIFTANQPRLMSTQGAIDYIFNRKLMFKKKKKKSWQKQAYVQINVMYPFGNASARFHQ